MKTNKKVVKLLYWLDAGIFPSTILFSMGFSFDEVQTEFKKKKATSWALSLSEDRERWDNSNYRAFKRVLENKKTGKEIDHFIIKIKEPFGFTDFEYCKLAHEVLHICQYMLPDILDRNEEHEAEAYFHTYLMNEILKRIRGVNK